MGWGTNVPVNLYFSRQKFETKDDLEIEIKSREDWLQKQKELLLLLLSSKHVIPEDWKNDPLYYIADKYNEIIEDITDTITDITRLHLWLDNFEKSQCDEY